MPEKKPSPCPFCNRGLVIIKVDDEKDGTYWGHPRDTPPEECFIHSLIVFFDQVDNWNIRAPLEVANDSASDNTTNGKIKPCSNKECGYYDIADREGCNCAAFHPERVEYCHNYRA